MCVCVCVCLHWSEYSRRDLIYFILEDEEGRVEKREVVDVVQYAMHVGSPFVVVDVQ